MKRELIKEGLIKKKGYDEDPFPSYIICPSYGFLMYQGNFLFKFCHKFSFTPPLPGVFILKIGQFSPLNIFQSPPTPSMVRNNWGFYTSDSDTVNVNYDSHSYLSDWLVPTCFIFNWVKICELIMPLTMQSPHFGGFNPVNIFLETFSQGETDSLEFLTFEPCI